jgi:hypothetical protein
MWAIRSRAAQVRSLRHEIEVAFVHWNVVGRASHRRRYGSSGALDSIEVANCRIVPAATAGLPAEVSVAGDRETIVFVRGKRHGYVVSITERRRGRRSTEEHSSPLSVE